MFELVRSFCYGSIQLINLIMHVEMILKTFSLLVLMRRTNYPYKKNELLINNLNHE